jgi:hypothetical protein
VAHLAQALGDADAIQRRTIGGFRKQDDGLAGRLCGLRLGAGFAPWVYGFPFRNLRFGRLVAFFDLPRRIRRAS